MSSEMVKQLAEEFDTKAVVGVPFDFQATLQRNSLVHYADPTVSGVYVLESDLDKVRHVFNM